MYNKVEICGVNTATLKVLTESEKMQLLRRMHEGDASAREDLVNGNLRLVLSVIQRFTQRGENLDDLFQVGCIGLIKAIDNFDVTLNVRFSTYAVPMIIGEIRRYLRDNNSIRISRSMRDTAYKAMQVKERLTNEKLRDPTVEEIAKELDAGIPNPKIKEIAIRNLSDREKRILNLRFFKGMTQIEVSSEIGISQAQVSRLEKGALDRIKKQI